MGLPLASNGPFDVVFTNKEGFKLETTTDSFTIMKEEPEWYLETTMGASSTVKQNDSYGVNFNIKQYKVTEKAPVKKKVFTVTYIENDYAIAKDIKAAYMSNPEENPNLILCNEEGEVVAIFKEKYLIGCELKDE